MKDQYILTVKELAEFIRLHEKADKDPVERRLPVMEADFSSGLKLSAVDCSLQDSLMRAADDDLDRIIHASSHNSVFFDLIDQDLIELNLRAENRSQVISKLARIAFVNRAASSYEELYIELEHREKMLSTAIGSGVAIPHSRFPHRLLFRSPKLIVARSEVGVEYGAPDGKKVYLFFMPCSPDNFTHVKMLAAIAKFLHKAGVIEQLKKVDNKKEMLLILNELKCL